MRLDPQLLETFLGEARTHLGVLGDPAADREAREVAAHGLLGLARIAESPDFPPLAREIERRVRAGEDATALFLAVERVLEEIASASASADPAAAAPPQSPATPIPSGLEAEEQGMLRGFFLEEAHEHLEAAQRILLGLGRDRASPELGAELFRTLHTLKGAAGTVGLSAVATAAHRLEDRIAALGGGQLALEADVLDTLLSAVDTLRTLVEEEAAAPPGALADPASRAAELLQRLEEDLAMPAASGPAQPGAGDPFRDGAVKIYPDRPTFDRRAEDRRAEKHLLRVDVGRIDELMDAVGELVFDRTRIDRRVLELRSLGEEVAKARTGLRELSAGLGGGGGPPVDRLGEVESDLADATRRFDRAMAGLRDEAESLRRTATVLQDKLQRVRMTPLRWLFTRLDRLVHEAARAERKQVVLESTGEATELDKSVVDQIGDPLLQLLSNAVAHGIEEPEERRRVGKPAEGCITFAARQRGEFVFLTVADDGRGIDPALVRERLVALGRLGPEEAAALDDERALVAIFERGFSTRAAADRLAGRGVGLDVVRDAIARLGGDITVASRPGTGSTFSIRLPLTTAITQALLFKVGGQVYALPAAHVLESAQIPAPLLRTVSLRGQELPVLDLHLLLGADPPIDRRRLVLALSFGDRPFVVTCDKIVGPRQIVVKSVGPLLKPLPLYAGATLSGAGKVQLILDLAALAAHVGREPVASRRAELGPGAVRAPRILLCDDSRTVREAVSRILQAAGYRVDAVPDGWEAWEALQDGSYDLLLTDLEMPRLGGWELIAKVRRDAELRQLPVLVISSRTAEPSRARAQAAGTQGFIAKPVNRRVIVERVARALGRTGRSR